MARDSRLRTDPIAEARHKWEQHGCAPAAGGMALVTSLVRAQQIPSRLQVQPGAVTNVVDRLESDGLVVVAPIRPTSG